MTELVKLKVALETDAEEIRNLMIVVEKDETERWYKDNERPFIPGYDSIDMQKYHMWDKKYYKILYKETFAGVMLISYTGREHARIDRFYIDPQFQNKGIGSKVITMIEQFYPKVKIWTLDTSQRSDRNHKFYEKNGFIKVGEDEEERYYEKIVTNEKLEVSEDFSNEDFRRCSMQRSDFYDVNLRKSTYNDVNLEGGLFQNAALSNTRFTNVNMSNSIIGDSKMDKVEICHVSLKAAYIHDTNLGFDEKVALTMERCELNNSKIIDSDLQNVSIVNCNIEGMKINGILVSELIKSYKER